MFVARITSQRHLGDPIPFKIQGTGRQTRSFVYVDDFIDGILKDRYREILKVVTSSTSTSVPILVHAYDNPIPDGRPSVWGPGPWLAIAPHDDDIVLGMGMVVAAAAAEGVEIHLAVTSDGGLGYLRPEDRPKLIEVRRLELAS